ncbi:DUF1203 domain-containing protein [Tropicimonas sp. IMCC6043]|uniref:DUF1203 domain-containing protein n=1 Tax=Tropicimonas sp. IMCC6043 TaxID=2510645 RepID=UPI00101C75EB|nr:DUF1203 domain-containing protein [Tropicimonas sp. IMCC6043]RYH09037.1 DUF1203 domain-containing protein [Tropicimonas sp. IMCC6043]
MPFQIQALPMTPFLPLVGASDAELAARNGRRVVAESDSGYPCRVSLRDAAAGETLLLVNFEHLPGASPFRASHAIFVREAAVEASPAPGDIPASIASRLLSVRGFDAADMLQDADVVEGAALAERLERMFAAPEIDYIHVHYAKQGCFAAKVTRTEG